MKKLPVFLLTFLLFCAAVLAPAGGGAVSAAEEAAPTSIDETNVLTDLEGSMLNGKEFNKDDFTQSDIRDPQIIAFVEYGYSFYANRQEDYGLYVYIYNPQVQVFDKDKTRNQIQLKAGDLSEDNYDLELLNYSTEIGYEGLFAKFKVALTDTEKEEILGALLRAKRVYKVTEFVLVSEGNAREHPCAQTYTYKGYAKGYGSPFAEEADTLSCSVDGFEEYIELDVHQTVYRPHGMYSIKSEGNLDGEKGGDKENVEAGVEGQLFDGIQPQLNSCYFRVPEKYFTSYGDLTKTLCQWYEYKTQPMLVTNDETSYQKLHALHGAPLMQYDAEKLNESVMVMSWGNEYYTASANWHKTPFKWASNIAQEAFIDDEKEYQVYYAADIYTLFWPGGDITGDEWLSRRFDNLAGIFLANSPFYTAEISAERIKSELLENSRYLGGNMLAGRYSEALFADTVDPGRIRGYNKELIELQKSDTAIWSNAVEKSDGACGFFNELQKKQEQFSYQKGITVTAADLEGTDAEIADRLLVAEADVPDLKKEFNAAQNAEGGERLILLRYAKTNYQSGKAIVKIVDTSKDEDLYDKDDTLMHSWMDEYHYDRINGYLAQETVFLDFEIISMWFATEDAETEIPVMMTPMDVISGLQPGVGEQPETITAGSAGLPWYVWLAIVLGAIVLIIALVLFFPVLKPIFAVLGKAIFYVVASPFLLIGWLVKKISEATKKKKAAKPPTPPKPPAPKPKGTPQKPGGAKNSRQKNEVKSQRPKVPPKGEKNEKEKHTKSHMGR